MKDKFEQRIISLLLGIIIALVSYIFLSQVGDIKATQADFKNIQDKTIDRVTSLENNYASINSTLNQIDKRTQFLDKFINGK